MGGKPEIVLVTKNPNDDKCTPPGGPEEPPPTCNPDLVKECSPGAGPGEPPEEPPPED